MGTHVQFFLTERPIGIESLLDALRDTSAGAVVTFDGRVRDHNDGHRVSGLAYQAYPALALSVGRQILSEESERHGVLAAVASHRTGEISIGDSAVWVGVAAEHRAEAFAAAQSIMERLKYELPIWKKESYANGASSWVGPDNTDAATGEAASGIPVWHAALEAIWISPGNDFRGHFGGPRGNHGIVAQDEVNCVAGMGLSGDRYFGYQPDFKGQVTFFEAEVVDAVGAEFGLPDISSGLFRRNLIVRGVRLRDWIGRKFVFQGVVFEGSEECKPCLWMNEAVADGVEDFLKPQCRGGLRARILSGGKLHLSEIVSGPVSPSSYEETGEEGLR